MLNIAGFILAKINKTEIEFFLIIQKLDKYKIMQYKCIYCLLDWRRLFHIVTHIQQHDWSCAEWQQFMRGADVHRIDRRRTRCSPAQRESRTSWGRRSSQAAHSPTAGPATAFEERCVSWGLSGSGWGPGCSWGPSAGFHTWIASCPRPTGGPLYASGRRLCSNPPSSSSLWHWQPSVASWRSRTSPGSGGLPPRTRIRSRCS